MDHTHENLFSRGSVTPPPVQSHFAIGLPQPNGSPNPIDSLFQGITNNLHLQNNLPPNPYGNSAPATPSMPNNDDSTSVGAPVTTAADRQSALLSLLYPNAPPTASATSRALPAVPSSQLAQQNPTPPASSQRSGQSPSNNSETQGKILLEQLMSGTSLNNYADHNSSAGHTPQYPQYLPAPTEILNQPEPYPPINYGPPEPAREPMQVQPPPQQPPQPLQQQQDPSEPRNTIFDFASPFDALASNSGSVKKKPVPSGPADTSSGNEDSWSNAPMVSDPKRKSVENLIDQLTRSQPQVQNSQPSYDHYSMPEEYSQVDPSLVAPQQLPQQQRGAPPPSAILPKAQRPPSPSRLSPNKGIAQRRDMNRSGDSPLLGAARRDKESSPVPRVNSKNEPKGRKSKHTSPSAQSQTIVFDVSQALDEIQAPRDAVKSTAIALVRQDAVFLPGTTIGATHWIAYAMTKGRVRVISRSSGDRTLLQLPPAFAPSTSVVDMAVFGNRLAGVTSDGGFVIWELPEVITDDVPGHLLLCIMPTLDSEPLQSVKWHPKQPDTLAVASEMKMYLLDLMDAARIFRGDPLPQSELHRISQVFSSPSRLVAFDFDVPHYALATIAEDSTLTLWNVHDRQPFWTHKVRGDDVPSSLTFIDDGIVIGRRNGTVFQLLSVITKNVLSTLKFVNGPREDPDMFGHINYDARIQTLWIANSRRDSMIAVRIGYDVAGSPSGDLVRGGYFEQILEFCGPKPTIHFVILSADQDPTGDEAHAACVAAKVPPGELALVAFSVHPSGVDQVLIRKEWFDSASYSALTKFPPYTPPAPVETKVSRQSSQVPLTGPSVSQSAVPARLRTPPSEEIEAEMAREEARVVEPKKNTKGKNVAFRDKDEKEKERNAKNSDAGSMSDSAITAVFTKEIRKTEESLHTRIGRLIGKEMEKQNQRLEEARAHEQAEDFNRQEKILKLISTELTRNTTRVVEMAVKAEVQASVLPVLEQITRSEVRAALNDHVGRGLNEYIQHNLPNEMETLLLRPDISGHFASILSNNLNPLIERWVKEAINKSFVPAYSQQTSAMHQDILREMRSEILNVKKDSMAWQTEALRNQESLIRDLEHSVRLLSDQVKFLSLSSSANMGGQGHHARVPSNSSPASTGGMHRQASSNHANQQYAPSSHPTYPQPLPPTQQNASSQWYSSPIAAPQASHPLNPPPAAQPIAQRSPPSQSQSEDWDDTFLHVLGSQDSKQLREVLARSNPEIIMPMNGVGPLSQAVILTLVHRLAGVVGETPPIDENFKSSLWWLQRAASILNTSDGLISPYSSRVVPNVLSMLNTTKQRLAILPGGPQLMDSAGRQISDIQDILSRKPM
ncbi:hypothetical protein CONPUDRAFT_118217 [Coniophora puteana RWD-64-598 SS2]|uniref:Enhancer of mRNA-decapping protein 4 WD40 repeat region domain-containing protein n=1 Tax=Coniophora puteana (strain RWD-64-598) TaxID=741705 RepID=A0A5M3N2Z1_CONPW|nr:uncharacterized protein CONPUDRAFT_118217 [Coniophora puteana RWD-64-598 SS2]EIW85394.1 hypothetical protein CONPUDRAFT_118217 [Coniophora puteana RWD-64-598 SS2]